MALQVRSITIDCTDPDRLATFWSAALGYNRREPPAGFETWADYLTSLGIPEGQWSRSAAIVPPDGHGPRLLFLPVPESKVVKNRVHLDLSPTGAMADEVRRLTDLGATVVQRLDEPVGAFTVMRDPEGNEFCVEAGPEEPG